MPHTARRKKNAPTKRVEVIGADGWTRVATSNNGRQAPKAANPLTQEQKTTAEKGSTVEKITQEYDKVRGQWLASDACKTLETLLKQRVLSNHEKYDICLIFGSGSFCGLRQGWIQRKGAAMCQLAVILTIRDVMEEATGKPTSVCAQDPAYNDIDLEFLRSLQVDVAETPSGFEQVNDKSIVYTPCAEAHVELEVLKRKPAALLTSKLDWYWRNEKGQPCTSRMISAIGDKHREPNEQENADDVEETNEAAISVRDLEEECQILERLVEGKQSASLPSFELRDQHPFRSQHLYWPKPKGDEAGGETVDAVSALAEDFSSQLRLPS